MNLNLIEASSFARIDRQLEENDNDLSDISPAQYEIIRQVIYNTADFEYYSQLKFSEGALTQGFRALKSGLSIVVDVPEIQVNIVPRLQQTFQNRVYCCTTTVTEIDPIKTKAALGLESLAQDRSSGIFVIGQDHFALHTLVKLIKNKTINPSLAIATAPSLLNQNVQQYLKSASIPTIYIDSPKGGATVASSIVNSLVNLAWIANNQ